MDLTIVRDPLQDDGDSTACDGLGDGGHVRARTTQAGGDLHLAGDGSDGGDARPRGVRSPTPHRVPEPQVRRMAGLRTFPDDGESGPLQHSRWIKLIQCTEIVCPGTKIAELQNKGFCVLKAHFAQSLIQSCGETFWPILLGYLARNHRKPNRGEHRHFLAMPFEPPCFAPEFFFDTGILSIVRGVMDEMV